MIRFCDFGKALAPIPVWLIEPAGSRMLFMPAPCAQTALDIQAPLERVWAILLDLKQYHTWNPFIIAVEDPPELLQVGSALQLCVRWADGRLARSGERVTQLVPPALAADGYCRADWAYGYTGWLARTGLVRATREHHLAQSPGGPTAYQTREVFRGLLARWVPVRAVQDGFERQTQALRIRAEA